MTDQAPKNAKLGSVLVVDREDGPHFLLMIIRDRAPEVFDFSEKEATTLKSALQWMLDKVKIT